MKSKQLETFKIGDLVVNTIFEIEIEELLEIEEETGVIYLKSKHYNYISSLENIRLATKKEIIESKLKKMFKKNTNFEV